MYNVYMKFKFWKMMYGWLTTCDSPISETFFKYFGILQFNFGYWKKCNIYPFGWQKKSSINVAFILSGNKNISNKYLSCHTFRKEWGGELRMNADQEDHINISPYFILNHPFLLARLYLIWKWEMFTSNMHYTFTKNWWFSIQKYY